jgi:hypothetical protein
MESVDQKIVRGINPKPQREVQTKSTLAARDSTGKSVEFLADLRGSLQAAIRWTCWQKITNDLR